MTAADKDSSDTPNVAIAWSNVRKLAMFHPKEVALHEIYAIDKALLERAPVRSERVSLVEVEKAKADAYEKAAQIVEEMSYPPEGQERWHGTDNEWAAIKLEDAAKAIREHKAKVCHVTQAIAPASAKQERE